MIEEKTIDPHRVMNHPDRVAFDKEYYFKLSAHHKGLVNKALTLAGLAFKSKGKDELERIELAYSIGREMASEVYENKLDKERLQNIELVRNKMLAQEIPKVGSLNR